MASPIQIDYVPDWAARLKSRLYAQFQFDPVLNLFISNVVAPQVQDLEDAQQSLLTITSIDDSEGINLQVIGRRVGQLWKGESDPDYRLLLRARVKANNSSSTVEDIYSVFVALFGLSITMKYTIDPPAGFELLILVPITAAQASIAAGFLTDSKAAGVHGILEWQEFTDDQMFTFANAADVTIATLAGVQAIHAAPLSGFTPTGTFVIDPGLSTEETRAYTSITGGTVLHWVTPFAFAHAVGAAIELTGDAGQGFAIAATVRSAASIGNGTLAVQDSTAFTSSGSVTIDVGLANEETIGYSAIVAGPTLTLVGTLTQNHSVGADVQLVGTTTGGYFSAAVSA